MLALAKSHNQLLERRRSRYVGLNCRLVGELSRTPTTSLEYI